MPFRQENINVHASSDANGAIAPPSSNAPKASSQWSGFHKKTLTERRALLKEAHPHLEHDLLELEDEIPNTIHAIDTSLQPDSPVAFSRMLADAVFPDIPMRPEMKRRASLPTVIADSMVENCIGALPLPLGLGLNITVNGQEYQVPMAIEEPSVIAAVSGACKTISSEGGFSATSPGSLMIGQVQLLDLDDCDEAARVIADHKSDLIEEANSNIPSMVARGGGVTNVYSRIIRPQHTPQPPFIVVHIEVVVMEAMGANVVNTISEAMKDVLTSMVGGRAGLGILSNLCDQRCVTATFAIPVDTLKWHSYDGAIVAQRIVEAYWFAAEDPYRATTHNKGVMNGIDAVALATGQDWRAIEAGAHAFASRSGTYKPLTEYSIKDNMLHGRIEVPMAIGTCGGSLNSHPMYKYTQKLLGKPSASTLAQIIGAVGLAQNFAALRALATEGIQKGHMRLHSRNVAIAAGCPDRLLDKVSAKLVSLGPKRINVTTATEVLAALVDTQA